MGELAKAKLIELKPTDGDEWVPGEKRVEAVVQFNPTSLKVTYSNQLAGGDQPAGSAKQFVGQGSTKMSLELWFDTTDTGGDVREKTAEVAYFIQPKEATQDGEAVNIAPRVQFSWGSFLFEGMIDSMDETLEFFSESGIPLRASIGLMLSEQSVQFRMNREAARAAGAGTRPAATARSGDTLQNVAARNNSGSSWQSIGEANDIDNPRAMAPGTPIRL